MRRSTDINSGAAKMGLALLVKLVSSAFALLFTEISVPLTTEISVKSSAKADETNSEFTYLIYEINSLAHKTRTGQ